MNVDMADQVKALGEQISFHRMERQLEASTKAQLAKAMEEKAGLEERVQDLTRALVKAGRRLEELTAEERIEEAKRRLVEAQQELRAALEAMGSKESVIKGLEDMVAEAEIQVRARGRVADLGLTVIVVKFRLHGTLSVA